MNQGDDFIEVVKNENEQKFKVFYRKLRPEFLKSARKKFNLSDIELFNLYQFSIAKLYLEIQRNELKKLGKSLRLELLERADKTLYDPVELGTEVIPQELFDRFEEWDFEIEKEQINQKKLDFFPSDRRLWLIMALLFILMSLLYYAYFRFPPDYQALYQSFHRPYPYQIKETALAPSLDNPWDQALYAYQKQDYKQAEEYFAQYAQGTYPNDTLDFYWGLSFLELNENDQALDKLRSVSNSSSSSFASAATWYSALAYLRKGKPKKSKTLLKLILGRKGNYQAEAQRLLQKLP